MTRLVALISKRPKESQEDFSIRAVHEINYSSLESGRLLISITPYSGSLLVVWEVRNGATIQKESEKSGEFFIDPVPTIRI